MAPKYRGSATVGADEEILRVVPFIEWQARDVIPTSSSASIPGVRRSRQACTAGADLINDTWAAPTRSCLKSPPSSASGLVCSHTGVPRTRPFRVNYGTTVTGVVDEVIAEVTAAADRAVSSGVERDRILIDPTHDFGKNTHHGLALLRHVKIL